MATPLRRVTNLIIALLIGVFSINIVGVTQVGASNGRGNNGTLKVHEFGTPSGTESNDPQVCKFNFEGFQFDPAQVGYVVIEPKHGGAGVVTLPFGATNASGYYATDYVNDGASGYSIANGDYAATLYGKDTGNPAQPNLSDVKAKSKNFKVDCPPQSITAQAPTYVDMCGRQNDTYTIPSTTGVVYKVGGVVAPAGTYSTASNTVAVTAEAIAGYTLIGTASWSLLFTNTASCDIEVTPAAPTSNDVCGNQNDTYVIPASVGAQYQVNGVTQPAGTYVALGSVQITATALPGYVFATGAVTVWDIDFTNNACPASAIVAVAVCSVGGVTITLINNGTADGYAVVNGVTVNVAMSQTKDVLVPFTMFPALVAVYDDAQKSLLNSSFSCPLGVGGLGGAGTPSSPVVAESPVQPAAATPAISVQNELPTTGGANPALQAFMMVVLAASAYGAAYYLQGRRI